MLVGEAGSQPAGPSCGTGAAVTAGQGCSAGAAAGGLQLPLLPLPSPAPPAPCRPGVQAALGGAPSRLGLVNAFLRVKEKDRGALDFDQVGGEGGGGGREGAAALCWPGWLAGWLGAWALGATLPCPAATPPTLHTTHRSPHPPTHPACALQPGGVDTTWQRIYCCLRAGFHAEAVQVCCWRWWRWWWRWQCGAVPDPDGRALHRLAPCVAWHPPRCPLVLLPPPAMPVPNPA